MDALDWLAKNAVGKESFPSHLAVMSAGTAFLTGTAVRMVGVGMTTVSTGLLLPDSSKIGPLDFLGSYMIADDYIEAVGLSPGRLRERAATHLLSQADPDAMLRGLGVLSLALHHDDVIDVLVDAAREQLSPAARERFDNVRRPGPEHRFVLTRQPLLATYRRVLTHVPTSSSMNSMPVDVAALLLTHAVAGDLAEPTDDDEERLGGVPIGLAIDIDCNQDFHDDEDLWSLLDRQVRLWREFGQLATTYLDGRTATDLLTDATGIELEDFLALGLGLYAHVNAWGLNKPTLLNDDFGSGMSEDTKGRFLEHVARTPGEFAGLLSTGNRSAWDFLVFQEHPVVRMADGLLVIDVPFLINRVTSGLYWLVHDHLKATEGDAVRHRWTQAWGDMVEALVEDSLRPLAPPLLGGGTTFYTEDDLATAYPGHKSVDVVIDMGVALVLFEIVSGRVSTATRIDGDPVAFASDMERLVYKKLRQLDDTARCLLTSSAPLTGNDLEATPIFPVIVTAGGFPVSPITSQCARDYCAAEKLLDHPRVRPLSILDVGDIEMLEGLAGSGRSAVDVLHGWHNSPIRDMPLHNHVLQLMPGHPSQFRPTRMDAVVNATFEAIIERLKLLA